MEWADAQYFTVCIFLRWHCTALFYSDCYYCSDIQLVISVLRALEVG